MVGGALAMQTPYVGQIPVPPASRKIESQISAIIGDILERKKNDIDSFVDDLDLLNDGHVAHLYGLSEDEFRSILCDLSLPDPVRVGALNAYRETKRSLAK